METALGKQKSSGATGEDNMAPNVAKETRTTLLKLHQPLILKSMVTCVEPVLNKGGENIGIYKGSGPFDVKTNHRAILVSNCMAKVPHSITRSELAGLNESYSRRTQHGTICNRSLEQALLSARTFQQLSSLCFTNPRELNSLHIKALKRGVLMTYCQQNLRK